MHEQSTDRREAINASGNSSRHKLRPGIPFVGLTDKELGDLAHPLGMSLVATESYILLFIVVVYFFVHSSLSLAIYSYFF